MSEPHIHRTGSPKGYIERTCVPRFNVRSNDKQRLVCLFLNNLPKHSNQDFVSNKIVISHSVLIPDNWFQGQAYNIHSLDGISITIATEVTRTVDHDSEEPRKYEYLVEARMTVTDGDGNEIDEVRLGVADHGLAPSRSC